MRATKPKTKVAPRGIAARKLAAARREIRLLLQDAQEFPGAWTHNNIIIERMNTALDALR